MDGNSKAWLRIVNHEIMSMCVCTREGLTMSNIDGQTNGMSYEDGLGGIASCWLNVA